jgi:hypothetical protein
MGTTRRQFTDEVKREAMGLSAGDFAGEEIKHDGQIEPPCATCHVRCDGGLAGGVSAPARTLCAGDSE